MCRWGCTTTHTTYMCKWCGTRYCKECLRGDFIGKMFEASRCRKCNHPKCQGQRVEYVPTVNTEDEKNGTSSRARSKSPSKSARSAKSAKSAKSSKKNSGKKSGKKSSGKKKKKK
ncbi:uncharacterized protein LOC135461981 [Liolophura sinensis]|uniref:uncharacterized protein LOC135461981 n=1 Tax=Liolophura sinensis TaxID=3198878 RepID=UPI0031591257